MSKKIINLRVFHQIIIFAVLFLLIIVCADNVKASDSKYFKVGNRKVCHYTDGTLVYKGKSGEITIKKGVISGIYWDDGLYFTVKNSNKMYKWNPKTRKTTAEATLVPKSKASYLNLHGGYDDKICFDSSDGGVYIYSKRLKRVVYSVGEAYIGSWYNRYFAYGYLSTSPAALYLVDMKTMKKRLITNYAFCGCTFINGKIYYADGRRMQQKNAGYKVDIRMYNPKTKKIKILTKPFYACKIDEITSKKVRYYYNFKWKTKTYS